MDCKTDSVVSLSAVGYDILIYQTCSQLFWHIIRNELLEKQDKKYLQWHFCDLLPFKKKEDQILLDFQRAQHQEKEINS
jgi:hypothetical protein